MSNAKITFNSFEILKKIEKRIKKLKESTKGMDIEDIDVDIEIEIEALEKCADTLNEIL